LEFFGVVDCAMPVSPLEVEQPASIEVRHSRRWPAAVVATGLLGLLAYATLGPAPAQRVDAGGVEVPTRASLEEEQCTPAVAGRRRRAGGCACRRRSAAGTFKLGLAEGWKCDGTLDEIVKEIDPIDEGAPAPPNEAPAGAGLCKQMKAFNGCQASDKRITHKCSYWALGTWDLDNSTSVQGRPVYRHSYTGGVTVDNLAETCPCDACEDLHTSWLSGGKVMNVFMCVMKPTPDGADVPEHPQMRCGLVTRNSHGASAWCALEEPSMVYYCEHSRGKRVGEWEVGDLDDQAVDQNQCMRFAHGSEKYAADPTWAGPWRFWIQEGDSGDFVAMGGLSFQCLDDMSSDEEAGVSDEILPEPEEPDEPELV